MFDVLLAAIRDQPADDLPRQALADWLEESGDGDRAHFIHLQLDQDGQPARSARAGELALQTEGMLAEHERRWLGDWADLLVRWSFRRGFLDSATLEPEDFLLRGEGLFARHPLREVRFVDYEGTACDSGVADELLDSPLFSFVRALDLSGSRPDDSADWCRALASADHLRRLEELNLSSAWQPDAVFADHDALGSLCRSEHLRSLTQLDLSSPLAAEAFGDEAIGVLLQAPFLGNLKSLNLGGWQISDEGLLALITSRRLAALEELDLSWCDRLSRSGLQALLESKHLPNLSTLCLGGDIDLRAVAHSPLLAQLERLDFCTSATRHDRHLPPEDWAEFAASPHAGRVRRLTLLHNLLGPRCLRNLLGTPGPLRLHSLMVLGSQASGAETADALASSAALRELTALELVACNLDTDGVKRLLEAPFLPGLRQFCVAGNPIQARGVQAIRRSALAGACLDDLHLHHCNLPAVEMRRLFTWRGLANVTRLELGSNAIDAEAMKALLASPHRERLITLHLASGEIAADALDALAASRALPRLRDVTVAGSAGESTLARLRERFGPRLKVDARA